VKLYYKIVFNLLSHYPSLVKKQSLSRLLVERG